MRTLLILLIAEALDVTFTNLGWEGGWELGTLGGITVSLLFLLTVIQDCRDAFGERR